MKYGARVQRAVGIVRVSAVAGREGEAFASPSEQRAQITAACERDGLTLVETIDELDVSGGTPLERRDGLRSAVEAVERQEADVIVVAYFDRLARSLTVQEEVTSRVEAAGGKVMALDFGEVTGASAAQWLSGIQIGAVAEYLRRSVRERSAAAQARAVARGVAPWPNIPPGYVREEGGTLKPAPGGNAIGTAFTMRAEGATIGEVRAFLRENGIERSYHGVQHLLASRVYLGEIHFGKLVNTEAHEPIVDRDTWERVQKVRKTRGTRPKSDRLLARLGVLRCATCGARMIVGHQTRPGRRYAFYRCPPTGDCPRRMAISATLVEPIVVDTVKDELADVEGRASAKEDALAAANAAEVAQSNLDAAIRVFEGIHDEAAARDRLMDLRTIRDSAQAEAHRLSHLHSALTVNIAARWDDLTLSEKREAIRLVIARVLVGPGRGAGRVSIELVGQHPAGD